MNALIIFTKIPIPGFSKTRLQNFLSPNQCAVLSKCFLSDLFSRFYNLKDCDIKLYYTPFGHINLIEDIIPVNIPSFIQTGITIGDRMYSAMKDVFEQGYEKVILVGSDIPDLMPKHIIKAIKSLNSSDIVFGPTFDGGYYLIGTSNSYLENNIFSLHETWGTSSVLNKTINISTKSNFNISFIDALRDIDTKQDLLEFYKNIKYNDTSSVKKYLDTIL